MSVRATASTPPQGGTVLRGILTGLVPLILFVVLGALAVLATTLIRTLTNGEAFLAQEPVLVGTLGVGLLLAFVAWVVGCVWALRRARAWGQIPQATATLWTLGASAIVLLLPVLLAILSPQHPAHPAA